MTEKRKGFEDIDALTPTDNGDNDGVVQANRSAEGIAPNRSHKSPPPDPADDHNKLPEKNQKSGERNLLN